MSGDDADDETRADEELIKWISSRITLPGYTSNMWNDDNSNDASEFLMEAGVTKLVMYMDPDEGGLRISKDRVAPLQKVKQLQYFLKAGMEPTLSMDNIGSQIQFGVISGSSMDSLLKMMNGLYLPSFLANESWPESVKKEFSGQLHKFMASLTETAHQVKGNTVLYLPAEDLSDIEAGSLDKDLVQRLESTLIHWTRQIKEVVSNQEGQQVDNSGPLEEIEFWRSRTIDLSGIRRQLDRPGVRSIVEVLKRASSSYLKPFETLSDMIQQGSVEAQNNLKFLSTLQAPCTKLAAASPEEIPQILPDILNLIRMIWSVSGHYNTDERVTGLLRKVSNQIIMQCSKKIDLNEILEGDVQASIVQLTQSIQCGDSWHDIYMKTARAIGRDEAVPANHKWDFDPSQHGIFAQIDAFVQRCHNLMEVCEGQLQFARKTQVLEKGQRAELPAFGGSRGSEIEKSLYEIEDGFEKHIDRLRHLDYDILNVKATNWHYDYNFFKNGLKDLEVMMTNVISSAWEGISTVAAGVELLESFYHLAIRSGMRQSVERKTAEVYQMFNSEIKRVKSIFDKHKNDPPLPLGQPRFAGSALWAKMLMTRVEADKKVLDAAHYLVATVEAEDARNNYGQLVTVLEGYMRQMHNEWLDGVNGAMAEGATWADRLDRSLMIRAGHEERDSHGRVHKRGTGHLEANFDRDLLRLFNEVRFWEKFHGDYPIPYVAHEMFLQQDGLRVLRESVMLVVRDYNTIIDALSPEERRLFKEHLRRADRKIKPGLTNLNWGEKHIQEWFIKGCRATCQALYDIVVQFKANKERIKANCEKIANCLLVTIEKNVVYDSSVFEANQRKHEEKVKRELATAHADIITTMTESHEFFKDHPREIQREWMKYMRKTDHKVEAALGKTVKLSLQELSRAINGDAKTDPHALFKVNLVLDDIKGSVEFRPTMSELAATIQHVSRLSITTIQVVPRLTQVLASAHHEEGEAPQDNVQFQGGAQAPSTEQAATEEAAAPAAAGGSQQSFYDVISNDDDILKILVNIMHGMENVSVDLGKIVAHYDRYAPIWSTDKVAFIRRYANTKRPLASFDMDITRYKNHQQDIQSEDPSHTVTFIRIDCNLLKQSLIAHCQQWQQKLTTLLHHNATTELHALHEYIDTRTTSLQLQPGDITGLSESLALLDTVKEQKAETEARFEPIEDMYKCLDKFDVHVSDEEKERLEQLTDKWTVFADTVEESAAMLKTKKLEMRKELDTGMLLFEQHVTDTRTEFKENGPFSAPEPGEGEPDVAAAFEIINEYRRRVAENRAKAADMQQGLAIFEIDEPEYKGTEDTQKELDLLEKIWSQIRDWQAKWDEWKQRAFGSIIVKDLDTEAAAFMAELQKFPRSVKQWKAWRSFQAILNRFKSTLPLISDLRSEAMRPRHWTQLQEEIQQQFDPHSDEFTLEKLTNLKLHNHAEAVSTLASVAARELNIENSLAEITEIWETQLLDLVGYKKYLKIRGVDDVNDNLEAHQLNLATMKNSPYYLTFAKDINYWIKTLNDMVETLDLFMNVQRTWMYLESIFMDSADIRKQLPAESTMFEGVNNTWIEVTLALDVDKKATGLLAAGLIEKLTRMNESLEKINKSLDEYLEKKRMRFPRFYFLSNDDLLEILGNSKDPSQVQKHIRKFFANIKALEIVSPQKSGNKFYEVVGIKAADGEEIKLLSPVVVEGDVEGWLQEVEQAMFDCLKKLLYNSLVHVQKNAAHKKASLENWVRNSPGSMLITAGQIGWTAKCTVALQDAAKAKKMLRKLRAEWQEYLSKLSRYVRGDLPKLEAMKLVALITIEVHARDVVDKLRIAAKNKVNVNSFDWTSQLRFYFEKPTTSDGVGRAVVKQTNTAHYYGYEYQGNNGRLVITGLTDRCYMTLTTALHLCRGGAPMGPAGTGKTETVKDLGKGLGKFVVVFNCSPVMGVDSLGQNFAGLSQTGAWGCFDEFNRIIVEVLSVVALQVMSILEAIKNKSGTFILDGKTMKLNPTVGIFVTMNPAGAGYTGRSKIPDNLASLFRPVAMMVPDSTAIAEIMMMSQGFQSANVLAKKLTTLLGLMDQQLSKQDHYAGGLRAINSILNRAAQLNRSKENDLTEELILMRALKDLNHSKLIAEDAILFDALMGDLFPNVEMPTIEYGLIKAELDRQSLKSGLVVSDVLTSKTIQLYEVMGTRHGNMLVGGTCGGKSTSWHILKDALCELNKIKPEEFAAVEVSIMNPKAVSTDELFGMYDPQTKEWSDGILSNMMRDICTMDSPITKWLLLDGPVDTLWIESMNTVLDDNKVLTLVNGDRISLLPNVKLLFEVQDLSTASPATVSRAGMVYYDVEKLGWRPMMDAWIANKYKLLEASQNVSEDDMRLNKRAKFVYKKESIELLPKLVEKYIVPMAAFRKEDPEAKDLIDAGEFCVCRGFTRLFDAVCTFKNGVDPDDEASYLRIFEMWFAFSCMWALGGPLTGAARPRFDALFRDIESQFPPLQTVFDYFVDPVKKEWVGWEEKVSQTWRPSPGTPFARIVVPTLDTVRHQFILQRMMATKTPFLIVGNTGTGKTSLVSAYLDAQPDSVLPLTANFSAATSSKGLQEVIESRLEKRQRNNFGPVGSRASLILFIDDLNMPKKEEYGAQPPIELLLQWYDYGFWFDREKQSLKNVIDMQLVASMGPPGGARSSISPCFQSRFNMINFPFPADTQVKGIFRNIISNHLVNFDETIKPLAVPMTNALVDLYRQVAEDFLPTPACCHYLFNMRDISRVFQGILNSIPRNFDTRESMIRLWVHEVMRVFSDRLVGDSDRQKFLELLNSKLTSNFETSMSKLFDKGVDLPLFADFLEEENAIIADDDDDDDDGSAPYQELTLKREKVKEFLAEKLALFNLNPDSVKADLVLFDSAVDHVCRIYRIIVQRRGCALLVGVGGSGRQSLTRLAAFIAEYKVRQITASKSYRPADFHEDLKAIYTLCGVENQPAVFLFTDMQIVHESFMEDINSILNSGEVTKLFPTDELTPILEELRPIAEKEQRSTSTDGLYNFFIERVRDNLHIVLAFSPVGADFRNRCRMYPALVNNMTIDWFNDWPAQALRQVAMKFLGDMDLGGAEQTAAIADSFCTFHVSAADMCGTMMQELTRPNYVTSTKYLDLVKGYKALLAEKRKVIVDSSEKLKNGLDKLDSTRKQVEELSVTLEEKTVIVSAAKIEAEKMLVEIIQKQRNADEQKKQVEIDAAKTNIEAEAANKIASEAKEALAQATPALEKAVQALSKLTKNSITEIKAYKSPPGAVVKVLSAVMILLGCSTDWAAAKKELSDVNFLKRLVEYDKDNMSNKLLKDVAKFTKQKDFNADEVSAVSLAAGAMCEWVCAMELYAKVFRDVEPRRIALQKAEAKLAKKQAELAQAEAQLAEVIATVQALEAGFKESEVKKAALIAEATALEDKLVRASQLVSGLGGERDRWNESITAYERDLTLLVGDVSVASAFISYAGPFIARYRDALIAAWTKTLKSNGVPLTPNFNFTGFMANPTDVLDWGIQGLPSDNFSIENGVLVERGLRWPLMIDPQGQANNWIKAKEPKIKALDFQTSQYMRIVETAITYGSPILIQDVAEYLDTSLDPLMRINLADPRPKSIVIGEKELSYTETFRLYITSNQPNPHYKPEITAATTLVNFAVVQKGLEDQMLGIVVKFEEPKLETEKMNLVKTVAAGKRKIQELEDEILSLLKNSEGDILEDKNLIETLNQSKIISTEVKEKLRISQETEIKIDIAREGYRACAVRASLCYFVLNDLAMVDPMYQFSLKAYIELYKASITGSREDKNSEEVELNERIDILNAYHTEAVYKYTCRALFERHKLLFAFQLCVNKMKSEDKMDMQEYDFFLRGANIMDRSAIPANPCNEWLSDVAWENITELDKLPNFNGLMNSFEQNPGEWRQWYQADDPPPEKIAPPGEWQGPKRDEFMTMLILNCLRPDRVVFATRTFIASNLGQQYTESPPFNLHQVYLTSSNTTPLIFVLSPGVDPTVELVALSKQVGQQLEVLALGQGQTPIALKLLEEGAKSGNWVFLANCHLNISWLPDLAKIVEKFATTKPHPNFRLWLSSDPTPMFPIALLQGSVKMTTEPPKGLKANLLRLYSNITEETFGRTSKPEKYKKLLFGLTFFHAVLIERKKFLSLGWNIAYDFNDSDFLVCEDILYLYLEEYEETPWDAIKYLIALANYGGRCTDGQDRKLLQVYSQQYFCESALTVPRFQLSSSDKYYIPEDGPKDAYVKYIKQLPEAAADAPEAFGQHPNADIASQMEETKTMLGTILSLQPKQVAAKGAKTREETVLELIEALGTQIPPVIDTVALKAKYEHDKTPLTVVMIQETDRYNVLLEIAHRTLKHLEMGIQGLMVISAELEEMFEALYNGRVPGEWSNTFKSIKSLAPWIRDLDQRIGQLTKWAAEGPPKVFWLSGFTFPTGYLTALLQVSARKNAIAIDSLGWDFIVLGHDESALTANPKEGAYIKGMFLEGARWDMDGGHLAEPNPMELFCPMPIVHFKPVEQRKKATKGLHATPMYIYPVRTGSRENPSFMVEVDLKMGPRESQFWTKRGTALLLSLDH